jgi:hypothetical protein
MSKLIRASDMSRSGPGLASEVPRPDLLASGGAGMGERRLWWEADIGTPADAPLLHPLVDGETFDVGESSTATYERAFVTLGLRPGTHAKFRITVERLGDVEAFE